MRRTRVDVTNRRRPETCIISMTVLKRVIAARPDKNKATIPASHWPSPSLVHFRKLRPYARAVRPFNGESYPRCIDVRSNKISLVYTGAVRSSVYLPTSSNRVTLATPRCKSDVQRPRSITFSSVHLNIRALNEPCPRKIARTAARVRSIRVMLEHGHARSF